MTVKYEHVRPETLSLVHIFDGEEVVMGGEDGQVKVAVFNSSVAANIFIRQCLKERLRPRGVRPEPVKHEWAADRPKQEVYHSTTLGPIPLSFTGRRLMQNLREAVQDMLRETVKAVKAGEIAPADWTEVSKTRGHLAQYMSRLEKGIIKIDKETISPNTIPFGSLSSQPAVSSLIQPSATAISADLASALAHRGCCGSEHNPAEGKLHGFCVVCGTQWPCPTAQYFLREVLL